MAILNLGEIESAEDLEEMAQRDLEGKTLVQIQQSIINLDGSTRGSTKAGVGSVIEQGYFGIPRNNSAEPDIKDLQVEVKTCPLVRGKDGKLRVKEPLSLNIINYVEEHKNKNIIDSSLYRKNRKILFVWYIHDEDNLRSEYLIKYVFLWEMSDEILKELNDDYLEILGYIIKGEAHHIHQYQHKHLTLCPKHGGTFKNPNDKKSKTKQPFSNEYAEIRAFRLKNSYMNTVIRRYLSKKRASMLDEFVSEKKPKPKK
ncbi:MAG: MutH/Sau3AI family endonuclease [bacterium]